MQPLSTDQAADLDDMIHISTTGTVTSMTVDTASFIIHTTQYITGRQKKDDVAVCAELARNPKWCAPNEHVPVLNAVVNVWSTLQSFDTYVHSRDKRTTCIVIDVKDITYLYAPKKEAGEKSTSPTKNKMPLQERFKRRDHK